MDLPDRTRLSRRDYLGALVATGGTAGLAACLEETGDPDVPMGDPAGRPPRQHAWNDALSTDDDGNRKLAAHHVLVALELAGSRDEGARAQIEAALRSLERAYAYDSEGLLFTLGYTATYFDRDGRNGPIPAPESLTSFESPAFDEFDALLHLASDHPSVVLEAEEALFGGVATPNGEAMDATLSGVFKRTDPRRTGFVGTGLPAEHTDLDGVPDSIPENAPFFMGFRSGFDESQATEDRVAIGDGPFEGGTTMHVSSLDLQLETWFEQDSHYQRVAKLFSPDHADEESVGTVGEKLETATGVAGEIADNTESDARTRGMVGHAQKAARARDDTGRPRLLRRDFNTVNGDSPGVHFLSLQRDVEEFIRTREAMTGMDLAGEGVGRRLNNGILQYIFVRRRGNYLIPPRDRRALPHP